MSRKSRVEPGSSSAGQKRDGTFHTDPFQKKGVEAVSGLARALEGKGRQIVKIAGLLVLVLVVGAIALSFWNRRQAAAQNALGKAMKTASSPVSEFSLGVPGQKTFKTERERAEAAVKEFETVASEYGGSVGEKAKYFAATTKLSFDRVTAQQELETLSKTGGEVGSLAKFALAQTKVGDGKLDEAVALYREVLSDDNTVISKDSINFEIAGILEKQGKRDEAVELYFNIAKSAAEAKDADGKAIAQTQTAKDSKEKVKELNPEKAKEIPEAEFSPLGF